LRQKRVAALVSLAAFICPAGTSAGRPQAEPQIGATAIKPVLSSGAQGHVNRALTLRPHSLPIEKSHRILADQHCVEDLALEGARLSSSFEPMARHPNRM
jgi:hypothetical protein